MRSAIVSAGLFCGRVSVGGERVGLTEAGPCAGGAGRFSAAGSLGCGRADRTAHAARPHPGALWTCTHPFVGR